MKKMTGIDLHSNNLVCGIVDMNGKRLLEKRLPCKLPAVLHALAPHQAEIETVAVESTYNWYWLVDGLQEHGYQVVLANPAGIQQYNGLKHSDDSSDVFFLADLLRLGILPTGYIYPKESRPVRDLLRRRVSLVQQRTGLVLSLKSLHMRTFGEDLKTDDLKKLKPEEARDLFADSANKLVAGEQAHLILQLTTSIRRIEKEVLKTAKSWPSYERLQTLPGVGMILGLTIAMETGPVERFASGGDFASYCRCVRTARLSNGKRKGENNGKCGNAYLAWAFVEAANFAQRYDGRCRQFYDRKKAQVNGIVATKALACKLSKAAWHMMKHHVDYNEQRMFGALVAKRISVTKTELKKSVKKKKQT
jgi:transposase